MAKSRESLGFLPTFKVFVDTSVYISALISSTGASNAILYAAEAGAFEVYISPDIFLEASEVLTKKVRESDSFKEI